MNHEIDPTAGVAPPEVTPTGTAVASALTLQDHALQEIDQVAAGLAALTEKYAGVVYDVATTAGMAEAKKARQEIREPRYAVEAARKQAGSELKRIAGVVNARAEAITEDIRKIEDPIDAQIKAEETRKQAEREARERAEAEALQRQQEALAAIAAVPGTLFGADVPALDAAIARLRDWDMAAFDEVFAPAAEQARATALEAVQKARDHQADLDQQAAALREQQAALEAEAATRREQQEREDAERRAKQEAEDRERAERQAAEDEARRKEQDRVAAEQAERQRQLDEQAAAQREAEAKAEQERLEAAQKAEADRLAREQAEAAERAQAAAQAEAEAIRRAGMLLLVDMPDGSTWSVPLLAIARSRAAHYAGEFDGDTERSLAEDTLPMFESDHYEAQDWAVNNMNWSDVAAEARIYREASPLSDEDKQEGWISGAKQVLIPKAVAP